MMTVVAIGVVLFVLLGIVAALTGEWANRDVDIR
jgi:uncharacterized protein involved in exopolysaccharide biosynthesis